MRADKEALNKLLSKFRKPSSFRGVDGYWNDAVSDMEDAAGETLAYVDNSLKLIIISDKLFTTQNTLYISATEYAEMHGKSRAAIKNMCAAGRIEGAYKTSSGWFIPKDASYPERKPREVKKQSNQ